jgi:dTMP kinase
MLGKHPTPHWVTAEPTSRPEGALVRRILKGELPAEPGTLAYLFAADRHEHLYGKEGILENIAKGSVVVCDRYVLSSLAYQGLACGDDLPALLNSRFPVPGLTLFFDVDPEISMARMKSRDQLEIFEKMEFQKKVREAYRRALAEARTSGWKIAEIDASLPVTEVSRRLAAEVGNHLGISLSA